jgi:hypothetical protein
VSEASTGPTLSQGPDRPTADHFLGDPGRSVVRAGRRVTA